MPKTLSKALFSKLLHSESFKTQMQDLHLLTGMECLLLDKFGNEALRFPREFRSPVRALAIKSPDLQPELQRLRQLRLAEAPQDDLPWIEVVQPLTIEQECFGYWVLSVCRSSAKNQETLRQFWIDRVKAGMHLSWKSCLHTWEALPVIPPPQQAAWLRMLKDQSRKALKELDAARGQLPKTHDLPEVVLNLCTHVQAHYMEPLHLKDLAKQFHISPEHLSRLFHQSSGLRFREYLAETRVNAACQALSSTRDPISAIALNSGFSTLSRFNDCFKTHTGMTPRQWRKRPLALRKINVDLSFESSPVT
jgi:AraC-like DNA-binding protein